MDALSQLSYTPVTKQNDLQMVWQTNNILTNNPIKFHCDTRLLMKLYRQKGNSFCFARFFSVFSVFFFVSSVLFPPPFPPAKGKLPLEWQPYA